MGFLKSIFVHMLALLGVAVLSTGILYLQSLSPVVTGLLIFAVIGGVLYALLHFDRRNRRLQQGQIGIGVQPQATIGLKGIEYYPDRDALGIVQTEFANVKNAWVSWYTGKGAIENGVYLSGKVKKMIFLHPDCNFEEPVRRYIRDCVLDKRSPEDEARSIREDTEKVHKEAKRIEIGWLKEIPDYFLVVNDPDSENAWVRMESFDLTKNAKDWHSYRIYKRSHPYLFEILKYKYEELWKRSEIKYGKAKKETTTKEKGKKKGGEA